MATHVVVRSAAVDRMWAIGRWSAMVALLGWVVAMVAWPAEALSILWYGAIPILPATFFLTPIPWRSVCPLATLNELGNRLGPARMPTPREASLLGAAGLVLFHLLVPARRFVFNEQGVALAVTVVGVGLLAIGLGAVFAVRSGFCNGLCPVLPIELLYGQAPVVRLQRGRCVACTTCTPRGCIDLAQGRAFTQVTGAARHWAWLGRPYGMFIAALPGFIVGYSQLSNGPVSQAPMVYETTLGWSLVSLTVVSVAVAVGRIDARVAQAALAALAGLLYYWFTGPVVAREMGLSPTIGVAVRWAGIAVVGWWAMVTLAARARRTE